MNKTTFTIETEINASAKTLFPFINSASGLEKWFADQVIEEDDNILIFKWDEKKYRAKRIAKKDNHFVRFEFDPENEDDQEERSYIELRIENNEMINTTFLAIEEFTEVDDMEDFNEVYNHCFNTLKQIVGGNNI